MLSRGSPLSPASVVIIGVLGRIQPAHVWVALECGNALKCGNARRMMAHGPAMMRRPLALQPPHLPETPAACMRVQTRVPHAAQPPCLRCAGGCGGHELQARHVVNMARSLSAWGAQAAVVGTSCRLDVLELLEKRVASRMCCRRELVLEPHAASDPSATPSALLQVWARHPGCLPAARAARLLSLGTCGLAQCSLADVQPAPLAWLLLAARALPSALWGRLSGRGLALFARQLAHHLAAACLAPAPFLLSLASLPTLVSLAGHRSAHVCRRCCSCPRE